MAESALLSACDGAVSKRRQCVSDPVAWGYGVGISGPFAVAGLEAVAFAYFMTEKLGASAAVAGAFQVAAQVVELLSQPVVGWLSDRLVDTSMGRRRPFLLPLLVAQCALVSLEFQQPFPHRQDLSVLWTGGLSVCFYLCYSSYVTVHRSMISDLAGDAYGETNRLSAIYGFAFVVGTIVSTLLTLNLDGGCASADTFATSMVAGAALSLCCGVCCFVVTRWAPFTVAKPTGEGFFSSLRRFVATQLDARRHRYQAPRGASTDGSCPSVGPGDFDGPERSEATELWVPIVCEMSFYVYATLNASTLLYMLVDVLSLHSTAAKASYVAAANAFALVTIPVFRAHADRVGKRLALLRSLSLGAAFLLLHFSSALLLPSSSPAQDFPNPKVLDAVPYTLAFGFATAAGSLASGVLFDEIEIVRSVDATMGLASSEGLVLGITTSITKVGSICSYLLFILVFSLSGFRHHSGDDDDDPGGGEASVDARRATATATAAAASSSSSSSCDNGSQNGHSAQPFTARLGIVLCSSLLPMIFLLVSFLCVKYYYNTANSSDFENRLSRISMDLGYDAGPFLLPGEDAEPAAAGAETAPDLGAASKGPVEWRGESNSAARRLLPPQHEGSGSLR